MNRKTFMPDVAGVLFIVALVAVLAWPISPPSIQNVFETVGCAAVPLCIPGFLLWIVPLLPIVGAVCCLRRSHLSLAIVAAVFGIFSVGALGAGSVLSLTALALVLASRDEFGSDFKFVEQLSPRRRTGAHRKSERVE